MYMLLYTQIHSSQLQKVADINSMSMRFRDLQNASYLIPELIKLQDHRKGIVINVCILVISVIITIILTIVSLISSFFIHQKIVIVIQKTIILGSICVFVIAAFNIASGGTKLLSISELHENIHVDYYIQEYIGLQDVIMKDIKNLYDMYVSLPSDFNDTFSNLITLMSNAGSWKNAPQSFSELLQLIQDISSIINDQGVEILEIIQDIPIDTILELGEESFFKISKFINTVFTSINTLPSEFPIDKLITMIRYYDGDILESIDRLVNILNDLDVSDSSIEDFISLPTLTFNIENIKYTISEVLDDDFMSKLYNINNNILDSILTAFKNTSDINEFISKAMLIAPYYSTLMNRTNIILHDQSFGHMSYVLMDNQEATYPVSQYKNSDDTITRLVFSYDIQLNNQSYDYIYNDDKLVDYSSSRMLVDFNSYDYDHINTIWNKIIKSRDVVAWNNSQLINVLQYLEGIDRMFDEYNIDSNHRLEHIKSMFIAHEYDMNYVQFYNNKDIILPNEMKICIDQEILPFYVPHLMK